MTDDENDWAVRLLRENQEFERMRRMQPGRGHVPKQSANDWVLLAILVLSVIAGFVL